MLPDKRKHPVFKSFMTGTYGIRVTTIGLQLIEIAEIGELAPVSNRDVVFSVVFSCPEKYNSYVDKLALV